MHGVFPASARRAPHKLRAQLCTESSTRDRHDTHGARAWHARRVMQDASGAWPTHRIMRGAMRAPFAAPRADLLQSSCRSLPPHSPHVAFALLNHCHSPTLVTNAAKPSSAIFIQTMPQDALLSPVSLQIQSSCPAAIIHRNSSTTLGRRKHASCESVTTSNNAHAQTSTQSKARKVFYVTTPKISLSDHFLN